MAIPTVDFQAAQYIQSRDKPASAEDLGQTLADERSNLDRINQVRAKIVSDNNVTLISSLLVNNHWLAFRAQKADGRWSFGDSKGQVAPPSKQHDSLNTSITARFRLRSCRRRSRVPQV